MDAATIVKRVRALSGITRKDLAALADLAPSTIGRIERGTLDPTWGTLSRILEATGYRISGDTVVSAGDPAAIAAARPVLESFLGPYREAISAMAADALTPVTATAAEVTRTAGRTVADDVLAAAQGALAPSMAMADSIAETAGSWLQRWVRAGWVSDKADADDMVTLAIAAGNAAKIARRNTARRVVAAGNGWRALAQQLEDAGIDYAVSGLIATREDRATAAAVNPVIYVEDPPLAVERLGLDETTPGRGVLLLAPVSDELNRVETDAGIRFVSRAQGVLDAFAGSGREPDKAEDTLRHLLTVSP